MTLRYRILYVGEHVVHLEAGIHSKGMLFIIVLVSVVPLL